MRRLFAKALQLLQCRGPFWFRPHLNRLIIWIAPSARCQCGDEPRAPQSVFGWRVAPGSGGWYFHASDICEWVSA